MTAQTMGRQEIFHQIDALPDSAMSALAEFVSFLQYREDGKEHIPNAETIAAIEELRAGKGKKFSSIEALMRDLHDESDD